MRARHVDDGTKSIKAGDAKKATTLLCSCNSVCESYLEEILRRKSFSSWFPAGP